MKGIILAGGKGTRLYPVTRAVSKQLLPVYDKPMIYYPLSTLMLAGIKDILLISAPDSLPKFMNLLGDGSSLGVNLSYAQQDKPHGIAQSFLIGEQFIGNDSVALILGDNIFYGYGLSGLLSDTVSKTKKATIFGYYVKNPQRYGVIEINKNGKAKSIAEKPKHPKSNYAVTGLYFYDKKVVEITKNIKPSSRGELEITDVNNEYLKNNKLDVKLLGRGYAWLDMGTCDSLIEASVFIKTMEERQGLKIGCIEEVAYRMGYINSKQLKKLSLNVPVEYGNYLRGILKHG